MELEERNLPCVEEILLLITISIVTPMSAWPADDGFTPLMTAPTLEHFIGDKGYWSFQNGVLAAQGDGQLTESKLLLTTERFGNFILKFLARSTGGEVRVLFRATVQPPGYVVGYEAELGGQQSSSLIFRKPGPFFPKSPKAEPGHAAPGFPDAPVMPFFREAEEIPLVRFGPSKGKPISRSDQWVEYQIAGLGDHVVIRVDGITKAHYRASQGAEEGMLGFRLAPRNRAKVELKDIQIQLLGDVRWPADATAGDLTAVPAERWKASPLDLNRISDEAWTRETRELLGIAGNGEGFRTLFDGKSLEGWRDATTFWSAEEGLIKGFSHNSFLVTEKEYANFILKGSVRMSPSGANSGVQVRSSVIPDGMRGYQLDIGIPWWGQLYHESTQRGILVPVDDRQKRLDLVRADSWNDFMIICKGNHLVGQLNGEVTFDFVDYYGEKTGRIGLQIHLGPPMKVEFRDLQIKELP